MRYLFTIFITVLVTLLALQPLKKQTPLCPLPAKDIEFWAQENKRLTQMVEEYENTPSITLEHEGKYYQAYEIDEHIGATK